jgi:prevent-host-death family protein
MKDSSKNTENQVEAKELKAKLGKYLRLVQSGQRLTIVEQKLPVAILCPYEEKKKLHSIKAKFDFREIAKTKFAPVKSKIIKDSLTLLREERGHHR